MLLKVLPNHNLKYSRLSGKNLWWEWRAKTSWTFVEKKKRRFQMDVEEEKWWGFWKGLPEGASAVCSQCAVLWLTLLTELQLASERDSAGSVWGARSVSMYICGSVCVCFCKLVIPHPLFTPSTFAARNVWSASYAGRLCQHSRLT